MVKLLPDCKQTHLRDSFSSKTLRLCCCNQLVELAVLASCLHATKDMRAIH